MPSNIDIPPCATRLAAKPGQSTKHTRTRTPPRIRIALPQFDPEQPHSPTSATTPMSPAKSAAMNLIPSMLMSSVPSGPAVDARKHNKVPLMSSKDPLSIGIMSVNFRRFVSKIGPVFWMQDRVEEIITWRKGWQVTTAWMAAYAFICYFPRLLFLLPQIVLIGVMLATNKYTGQPTLLEPPVAPDPEDTAPAEGSVDWQANIQAIQNLMGIYSDLYDAVYPYVFHISRRTPYTQHILTLLCLSILPSLIFISLPYLPIRAICLVAGLGPIIALNPYLQRSCLSAKVALQTNAYLHWARLKLGVDATLPLTSAIQRLIDNSNLTDACWNTDLREVELFENERLGKPGADGESKEGWTKAHLQPDERPGWTRGQDGWNDGSVNSNLTFSLDDGWSFVDTEDWRLDLAGSWTTCGADAGGWVYTNGSWLDAKPAFYSNALTRRRRWTRRIWYSGHR
ncbi:hypothetical protein CYLTODRAFT_424449 [Cylindrobasidium torrendii FP15055 ss-10]|uniref:TECPR1-like DysF domain-containing protein n=1 Tax=Cylindrobasidium torrendii FP15055 ss-10 TaxID=1314674 RepID=A0A0D7B561_9AGAR|nr:hypothetical protein CYLTODRAFT_424449 [Cylindrobasidium torrendii FP15055 ss-10]